MADSKFVTYNCKVRLEGSPLNEVPKEGITAAEIEMYRGIHGSDAVVSIKPVGEVKRSDLAERRRVKSTFIDPTTDSPLRVKQKTEMFSSMFGHDSLPMPKELVSQEAELSEEEDSEEAPAEAARVVRTRVSKPAEAASALE